MNPQRVYLVTDGAYSDYHVVAVFADHDAAHAYATSEGYRRRGWKLDVDERPIGMPDKSRTDLRVGWEATWVERTDSIHAYEGIVKAVNDSWITIDHDGSGGEIIRCWAETESKALKIAQDRRAEFLAVRAGV